MSLISAVQPIKAGRRRTPLAFTDPREPLSGDPLTDVPEVEFPAGWDPRSPTADVPRTPKSVPTCVLCVRYGLTFSSVDFSDAAKAAAAASDGDTVVDRTPLGFPDPRLE